MVPTMSAGSMSGVNCRRLKRTDRPPANVLSANVLARPGTPSSRTWPLVRRATSNRSSRCFWPTMTRAISACRGAIQLELSITFSRAARMAASDSTGMGRESWKAAGF